MFGSEQSVCIKAAVGMGVCAVRMISSTLLLLLVMPIAWAQPFPIPPTCYSKVLSMGRDISQISAQIKQDPYTSRCTAGLPILNIDVHNACVMSTMRSYLSLLSDLRAQRCGYTRKVQGLAARIKQLHIIISQKCHGDLVFTHDNCEALRDRG